MEQSLSKTNRSRVLLSCLILIFLIIAASLFRLQVLFHSHYLEVSEENRIRVVPIPPYRGKILDREGHLLVSDRPSYTVSVVPSEAKELTTLSAKLSELLNIKSDKIEATVQKRKFRRYEPVRIKRDVTFSTVCLIEESAELFPGVLYQLDHAREYHYGNLACHLLGYVGEVSDNESKSGFDAGSIVGRSGIEKYYDNLLRGISGVEYLEVSATGRLKGAIEEREGVPPIPGSEVFLTLDLELQLLADSLFGDTLNGAAVYIDPRNGEILALVSKPTYDANLFSGLVSGKEYRKLLENPGRPLFDRTMSGTYPPGSTAKLLTAAAALHEGIITANTRFSPCFGGYQFGNRYFRCWKPSGHGNLDLYGAIEQSCDTYFYQLGLKMGLDTWSKYARIAGFAGITGIDLPAEKPGNVPDEDWYDKAFGRSGWTKAVMLNLAIGQGELLTTPIGLAQFFCGIVNESNIMKPHLLLKTISSEGEEDFYLPEVIHQLPFSQETLSILLESCYRVVHGEHGTAKWPPVSGFEMGGKTGTAQNPHGNEHSWFVGYAPAENPQIVGCVIVEQAGHGSTVAAPMVKKVITRYLEKSNKFLQPEQLAEESGGIDEH